MKERLFGLRARIKRAAEKSGRSEEEIRLVGVTKTVPAEKIIEAARCGLGEIGENKIQEALSKRGALSETKLTRHFIGHLQRNKVRRAVEIFDLIQSIDGEALARAVDQSAKEWGKKQACLIEVKISKEPAKTGIFPDEVSDFVKNFQTFKNLQLKGLMTIGPNNVSTEETRILFRNLSKLFQQNLSAFGQDPILSMGMSEDFEMAIEEGSTMIRLGRALFGERPNL